MAASNSNAAPQERQVSEIYAKYFQGTLKPQFVIIRKGEKEGNEWLKKLARNPFIKKLPKSSPVPSGLGPASADKVYFVAELATVNMHDLDHPMPDAPSVVLGVNEVDVVMADAPPLEEVHELDSTELLIIIADPDIEMKDAPPLSPAQGKIEGKNNLSGFSFKR